MEALDYAEGMNDEAPPPKPHDYRLLGYIDRFGVEAVMGRPVLSFGEIRRMVTVENIINASLSQQRAMEETNVVEWANQNPVLARIVREAEELRDAD